MAFFTWPSSKKLKRLKTTMISWKVFCNVVVYNKLWCSMSLMLNFFHLNQDFPKIATTFNERRTWEMLPTTNLEMEGVYEIKGHEKMFRVTDENWSEYYQQPNANGRQRDCSFTHLSLSVNNKVNRHVIDIYIFKSTSRNLK